MAYQLPPAGTHGVKVPGWIRPVIGAIMSGVGNVGFRRGWKVQGRPLLRLTTTGARTGRPRQVILGWFPGEEQNRSWVVVGSNGGAARHPSWAYNLAKNPQAVMVDMGDGKVPAAAELLEGDEREEAWKQVIELAPGYRQYTNNTDRELPIFRLSPRES